MTTKVTLTVEPSDESMALSVARKEHKQDVIKSPEQELIRSSTTTYELKDGEAIALAIKPKRAVVHDTEQNVVRLEEKTPENDPAEQPKNIYDPKVSGEHPSRADHPPPDTSPKAMKHPVEDQKINPVDSRKTAQSPASKSPPSGGARDSAEVKGDQNTGTTKK